MDVDSPSALKRCNSAPIINEINLNTTMTTSTPSNSVNSDTMTYNLFGNSGQSRTRRFSASFSSHVLSPNSGPRLSQRVNQLRQEECIDNVNREANHEREIHSAMQISQSYEDLTLDTELLSCKSTEDKVIQNKESVNLSTRSSSINNQLIPKMLPLNLQMPSGPPVCSSPSPTRVLGRQCFSPGLSWKNSSCSPSPTRKSFTRRSLSPIAMRPSALGPVKRKCDLEEDGRDYLSPAKKPATQIFSHSSYLNNSLYNNNTPTSNLLISQHTSSPVTGSLSSVGTPESMSSIDSPNLHFAP